MVSIGKASAKRGAYEKVGRKYRYVEGSTGLGSSQDRVSRALNAYRASGGTRTVTAVASSKSRGFSVRGLRDKRIVRSRGNLIGVKYTDSYGLENVGWLTEDGRIIGEDELLNALNSLDEAAGLDPLDEGSLVSKYLAAGPAERAKMAEELIKVEWGDLFKEIYEPTKFGKQKAPEDTISERHTEVSLIMDAAVA